VSATSPSVILSQRDVEFLLYEWLNVQALTAHERYSDHSREIFDAVLDLSRTLAEEHYRPHNQMSDAHEPHFDGERVHIIPQIKAALEAFAESGLLGSAMDASVGGEQLPQVVARACAVWLQAANASTSNYHLLSAGNANLLAHYGTADQIRRFVRPVVEGRFSGTMCLSEPQAGSSLSDVQTRAVPDGNDYRLFGSKMWISGGDHELTENIVHLVLARIEGAAPGVKGLSLFIVPRFLVDDEARLTERNDVTLAGINHKMGQRGCVNTVLSFGDGRHQVDGRPGAVGYLVGQPGQGLAYMFHMMNEARIAVGSLAVALGYTGYLHSLDYARTRLQGRLPSAKDPSLPQTAIVHHPDVRRMLLTQKSYVEGGLGLILYVAMVLDRIEVAPDEQERARLGLLLDVLTPIVKAWPSQWCLKANDLAIQVLGGYGYTRDYPLEQFYRDRSTCSAARSGWRAARRCRCSTRGSRPRCLQPGRSGANGAPPRTRSPRPAGASTR